MSRANWARLFEQLVDQIKDGTFNDCFEFCSSNSGLTVPIGPGLARPGPRHMSKHSRRSPFPLARPTSSAASYSKVNAIPSSAIPGHFLEEYSSQGMSFPKHKQLSNCSEVVHPTFVDDKQAATTPAFTHLKLPIKCGVLPSFPDPLLKVNNSTSMHGSSGQGKMSLAYDTQVSSGGQVLAGF